MIGSMMSRLRRSGVDPEPEPTPNLSATARRMALSLAEHRVDPNLPFTTLGPGGERGLCPACYPLLERGERIPRWSLGTRWQCLFCYATTDSAAAECRCCHTPHATTLRLQQAAARRPDRPPASPRPPRRPGRHRRTRPPRGPRTGHADAEYVGGPQDGWIEQLPTPLPTIHYLSDDTSGPFYGLMHDQKGRPERTVSGAATYRWFPGRLQAAHR